MDQTKSPSSLSLMNSDFFSEPLSSWEELHPYWSSTINDFYFVEEGFDYELNPYMVDFGFEYCQEMLSHIVGSGMWEGMSAPLVRAVRRVERVEKPVIDPFTAMITGPTEISITSATSGAEIIYVSVI